MSKRVSEGPGTSQDTRIWDKQLEELSAEYWTSTELTEEEKRFLDELERLPEEEWEQIAHEGKPVSETIIEEREAR